MKVKGLDDSQFVIAAVYFTSIFWAVIMVTSISLREYKNAAAIVYSTGFFISTTVILLLIFVPKVSASFNAIIEELSALLNLTKDCCFRFSYSGSSLF